MRREKEKNMELEPVFQKSWKNDKLKEVNDQTKNKMPDHWKKGKRERNKNNY